MFLIRWFTGCAVTGVAVGFGYREDWAVAVVAAAVVLVPVALRVRRELLATRDMLCGQPVAGKHRRRGRPQDAAMAALTAMTGAHLP